MKKKAKRQAKKKPNPKNYQCQVCHTKAPQRPGQPLPKGWSAFSITTTPVLTALRSQMGVVCGFPCLLVAMHEMANNTRIL